MIKVTIKYEWEFNKKEWDEQIIHMKELENDINIKLFMLKMILILAMQMLVEMKKKMAKKAYTIFLLEEIVDW